MAVWPPAGPPIAHGLPGSSGCGGERVVAALAVGDAHRMDGRQIHHVEAQLRDARQRALGVGERAVPRRVAALRAREHLVPRREPRALAIDPHAELAVVRREVVGCQVLRHEREQLEVERFSRALVPRRRRVLEPRRPLRELASRVAEADAMRGRVHELGALEELERHVLPGVDFLLELGAPGAEAIGPGIHGECPAADRIERDAAGPTVRVVVEDQWRRLPIGRARRLVAETRGEDVVSVLEDVGAHLERVAQDAFDGPAPVIERWGNAFDCDMRWFARRQLGAVRGAPGSRLR